MSLPSSMMPAGYEQTILEIREKLERRITNASNRLEATPAYHRGRANPSDLPPGPLNIWCDWSDVSPNDDGEPFQASSFISTWWIEVVSEDEGNDSFGSEAGLGERIWGQILKTLTATADDLGLSGTIDYLTVGSRKVPGYVSGTRRVTLHEVEVKAIHQMELIRSPAVLAVET